MKTLTLKDGRKIDLTTRAVVDETPEAGEELAPESFTPAPRTQVRLEDLPAKPAQMNVICAIMGYRLLGVPDNEICFALGCDLDTLERVVYSSAYDESMQEVIKAFVAGQKATAKDVLSANAVAAANELVKVSRKSKNENNRLRASESILSRVGITSDTEGGDKGGGLRIKIVNDVGGVDINLKVG